MQTFDEVYEAKRQAREVWNESIHCEDDEKALDVACLLENYVDLCSFDKEAIISTSKVYSSLMSHRIISIQPVFVNNPVIFYRDKELQAIAVNPNYKGYSQEYSWDKHILEELQSVAGYFICDGDNSLNYLSEKIDFDWMVVSQKFYKNSGFCGEVLSYYPSGVEMESWNNKSVFVSYCLPERCEALVGIKGNTKYESSFIFSPLVLVSPDGHGIAANHVVNERHYGCIMEFDGCHS